MYSCLHSLEIMMGEVLLAKEEDCCLIGLYLNLEFM